MAGKWVDTERVFVVHPDSQEWLMNYRKGAKFQDLQDERNAILAEGEDHHQTDHDIEMLLTAEERTLMAAMMGWKFPNKKAKK